MSTTTQSSAIASIQPIAQASWLGRLTDSIAAWINGAQSPRNEAADRLDEQVAYTTARGW